MTIVNRDSFTSFWTLMLFISFSCFIIMFRSNSIMLNKLWESISVLIVFLKNHEWKKIMNEFAFCEMLFLQLLKWIWFLSPMLILLINLILSIKSTLHFWVKSPFPFIYCWFVFSTILIWIHLSIFTKAILLFSFIEMSLTGLALGFFWL